MLTLRSKTPVRFEWSDHLSETTVTLSSDDDSETIKDKLQRILDLEGSQGLPVRQPGSAPKAAMAAEPLFTAADRAAEDARLAGVQTMGWADEGPDVGDLPEA